ncbi:MAG: acyl carrier protein [Actinobacteria bacterium]|nr:acyl carrier protein [Actinomycetota bacterium]
MQNVFEKLREIVARELKVDPEKITLDSAFVDDLGADSLDMVELVMALEDEFGISISDEDAQSIRTIRDAVEYIENAIA